MDTHPDDIADMLHNINYGVYLNLIASLYTLICVCKYAIMHYYYYHHYTEQIDSTADYAQRIKSQ